MAVEIRAAIKRADKAFEQKQPWIEMLRDVFEYALPMRNTYTTYSKGSPKMDRVFDSTAIHSTMRFGSVMQANLFPPFQEWVDLKPGPLIPDNKKREIAARLQVIQKKFFAAINNSAFPTVIGEFLLELATGTAAMLMLEGDDDSPFRFIAVPNHTFAIDEGPFGSVDGCHRRVDIEVRNIVPTWDDAELPVELTRKIADDPNIKVELTETTYYDHDEETFCYRVFWKGDNKNGTEGREIVTRKYEEHPWIVARWIKAPGEVMGRGPLMFALPDIKTANKVVELILKNASLAIAGVWQAKDDGVINPNTIRIVPGAVIPVGDTGNVAPLEFGGRFDVAQIVLDDLRSNIKKIMFDQTLPPETGSPRSATEIIHRVKEMSQDFGSPFGRIMTEIVQPILQRGLNIMHRMGIEELPVKVNGLTVQVTATSPLAKLQSMSEIETVVRWIETTQAVAGPEATMLGVKVEELPKWLGLKFGADPTLIRAKSDVDKMQQMAGAMMAQGQQIPTAGPTGAEGIPTGGSGQLQLAA